MKWLDEPDGAAVVLPGVGGRRTGAALRGQDDGDEPIASDAPTGDMRAVGGR